MSARSPKNSAFTGALSGGARVASSIATTLPFAKTVCTANRTGSDRGKTLASEGVGSAAPFTSPVLGSTRTSPDTLLSQRSKALPLEPAAAEALRKWFDNAHTRSRSLTKETAAAPRLRLPDGDAEGKRLWEEYMDLQHCICRVPPCLCEEVGDVAADHMPVTATIGLDPQQVRRQIRSGPSRSMPPR